MTRRTRIAAVVLVAALAIQFGPHSAVEPVDPIRPKRGLMVLIVEEASERSKLPANQVTIFTSTEVREYLDKKCAKDADGHPLWRFVDDDIEADTLPAPLQQAFEKERKAVPWLLISNGSKGVECDLPANVGATMKLLKKYGGA